MNFASDNTAGVAPEIMQAMVAGNDGFTLGYGNDDLTRSVETRIGEIFERHGFIWGGKWYHYDTMHFEYRPEFFI